jgi:hypothetical protein
MWSTSGMLPKSDPAAYWRDEALPRRRGILLTNGGVVLPVPPRDRDLPLEDSPLSRAPAGQRVRAGAPRRAAGLHLPRAVWEPQRQGGARPVDSWSHGHARALCASGCPVAGRVAGRAVARWWIVLGNHRGAALAARLCRRPDAWEPADASTECAPWLGGAFASPSPAGSNRSRDELPLKFPCISMRRNNRVT